MERPDEVNLNRQDGEALIERLHGNVLTAQDRRVLEQVLQWYFWLLFALQEARCSLKRLRAMLFGEKPQQRTAPPSASSSAPQESDGGSSPAAGVSQASGNGWQAATGGRPGHGRWGAQA